MGEAGGDPLLVVGDVLIKEAVFNVYVVEATMGVEHRYGTWLRAPCIRHRRHDGDVQCHVLGGDMLELRPPLLDRLGIGDVGDRYCQPEMRRAAGRPGGVRLTAGARRGKRLPAERQRSAGSSSQIGSLA